MNRRNALKNTALMAGVTLGGTTLASMINACQQQHRLSWKPVFFSESQAKDVSAIVDMLLPKTEPPGGLDLKVDLFVDLMCEKTLSTSDKEHVLKTYETFLVKCLDTREANFYKLEEKDKKELLQNLGKNTNTFNPGVWGSPLGEQAPIDFYRRVRQFALVGYFTSEEIGKNHLVYDPIPGTYKGCIPYNGENSWTL
jgi:hypothetical protein